MEIGRACLHHAASYGFENCLDALLSRPEIETDARDSMGDTALHLASANGFPMCAFNLTKAAPQTCLIANSAGQTAIDAAVANDRGEVLNAMLLACAGIRSAGSLESISALLEAGAVPDTWAPNGSSALMLAAAVDSVDALQVLLKSGATVELQDALGRTALMFAAGSGAEGPLQALLDAGASLAARDRRGKGILDYAPPDTAVRTILEDRLKELEAAAEQLQAALLASLDAETSGKAQQASKTKRKAGKKGKRSKKDGPSAPAPPPSTETATIAEEEAEGKEESAKDEAAQAASPTSRQEEPQSEAESCDTSVVDNDRGPAAAAASATAMEHMARTDARASTSEDDEDWKVVGKSARKLHGKGATPAATQPLQQPTGTATPPQQRPAPYKRCPSATSLSDSTCSAESEQSVANASGQHNSAAHPHPHHQHTQQPQQQSGASASAAASQPAPARPVILAAKAVTPPKPALSLAGAPDAASRGGAASTAAPAGRLADGKQRLGNRALEAQPASQQRISHPDTDTWAGKVAGTPPKPHSHATGSTNVSAAGSQCTNSQPSHPRDPPCAKRQGLAPDAQRGAVGRGGSLPALDAAARPALPDELVAARAEAAMARRECLLLAAEVERLRTALAVSKAARQQEVAQLLKKAAHHESLAVEEAVRQEKAAMTGRLLSTFESLKGLNMLPAQPAAHTTIKGVMGTLLDVQPGAVIGSRPAAYPPADAEQPFSTFGPAGHNVAGAASFGTELSQLLCGMGALSAAFQPPMNGAAPPEGFGSAPLGRCNPAVQAVAEPFSFFNGSSNIWK